jgi:hypothetical protein
MLIEVGTEDRGLTTPRKLKPLPYSMGAPLPLLRKVIRGMDGSLVI